MMGGGGSRYPFTLSQWHELELQVLVFRYMVSGISVPSDLVLCIRRRLFVDPQTLSFLPSPPAIGWGAYRMGGARKAMDSEPGRCRRTDGKKWRCSKEAYPDSKYCEKHMHRGKSRSRKPVELSLATSPVSPPLSRSARQTNHFPFSRSSSARPPVEGYSSHKDSTNLSLDSPPQATDNYRSTHGHKEGVNEYPFLLESSRGGREMSCSFGLSEMGSKRIWSSIQSTDSLSRILVSEEEMEKQYFLSGTDGRTDSPAAKLEEEQPRPYHCFLDEKPPENEDPWMSMNMDSKTQLSISLPMANHT